MHIARVQVEEGFLHGLDVKFSAGLNVLIGARGTGKTSLIELIRFCFGVPGSTPETSRRSRDHALSILGSGQVTITLHDGRNEIQITRAGSDEGPKSTSQFERPAIFSQTEIETVGLQASGRLSLIDSFLTAQFDPDSSERQAKAEFASLSSEVEKLRRELDDIEKQVSTRPAIIRQLVENAEEQKGVAEKSMEIRAKTQELDKINEQIARRAVIVDEGARRLREVEAWYAKLDTAIKSTPKVELMNEYAPSAALQASIFAARDELALTMSKIGVAYHAFKNDVDSQSKLKTELESVARQLRQELELLAEGAGQVLRKSQQLQEQIARLEAISNHYLVRRKALNDILEKRVATLDRLDRVREERFTARSEVVRHLNKLLGPRIRILLSRNAQHDVFESAISTALKGSGLRFNDIAASIAKNLSPRALIEAVDAFDQKLIADVADIAIDRAARTLSHLRSMDMGTLGTTDVDDDATFQLLDGKDFKDFTELSTGQRCTVVLPMVLAHKNRVVVVDQPEDHIDNAFIAETLIRVLLERDASSQIIFSTHNPNIPVLGNSEFVLQMGSDGRRGFVLARGDLSEKAVVQAISNVMEGGAQAFAVRSKFYSQLI